jgi:predicted aspartyl protease
MPDAECGFIDVQGGAKGNELLVSYGPTILVDIGFDPNFKPGQAALPAAGITGIRALVDTGATESCIDSALAAQLNLPVIDQKTYCGIGGKHLVKIHLAQISIPILSRYIWGYFVGVHLEAGGQWHKAIIGRTFLKHYKMTYDGRVGKVTISSN